MTTKSKAAYRTDRCPVAICHQMATTSTAVSLARELTHPRKLFSSSTGSKTKIPG